jgi:hypothetical protein
MLSGTICPWELQVQCTMNLLVDVVWNNMSLRTVSTMHVLVDVVWNNMSLRTACTMHNELLGGWCLEQSVLENCKYNAQWTSWWMLSGTICP